MKNTQINQKATINLPEQNVWRALESYGMDIAIKKEDPLVSAKTRKIGHLLDQAFELLLEKLIRQN